MANCYIQIGGPLQYKPEDSRKRKRPLGEQKTTTQKHFKSEEGLVTVIPSPSSVSSAATEVDKMDDDPMFKAMRPTEKGYFEMLVDPFTGELVKQSSHKSHYNLRQSK